MLYPELLKEELKKQKSDFKKFAGVQNSDLEEYSDALLEIGKLSSEEVVKKIESAENSGAIPSDELDSMESISLEFGTSWTNHEDARNWANDVLKDRTTFAADGSQLYTEKETSLPVGAIQVGWFENPHNENGSYEKNAAFTIISPQKLLENQKEVVRTETLIGQMRFEAEIERVKEFLSKHKNWREEGRRMPLAFYDGTLLLQTALPKSKVDEAITNKLVELANHSIATRVPIIGYVDRSFSKDLITLVKAYRTHGKEDTQTLLNDTTVLSTKTSKHQKVLKNWGDRTCFFYSKRQGLEVFIDPKTGRSIVGFSYLQTTADSNPARIDVPSWVFEEGLLNEIVDVVRAECVVGVGYPYVLETADVTAVISNRDRQVFLAALQEFATREKLNFKVSRKSASKGRRR